MTGVLMSRNWDRHVDEESGRPPSASPGEQPQKEPTLQHLDLGLQASRTEENTFLLLKACSPSCFASADLMSWYSWYLKPLKSFHLETSFLGFCPRETHTGVRKWTWQRRSTQQQGKNKRSLGREMISVMKYYKQLKYNFKPELFEHQTS